MGNYLYQITPGVNVLDSYENEISKDEAIAKYGQAAVDAIATPIAVDAIKAQASVAVEDGTLVHVDYNSAIDLYAVLAKPVDDAPAAQVALAQAEAAAPAAEAASTETVAPVATEGVQ